MEITNIYVKYHLYPFNISVVSYVEYRYELPLEGHAHTSVPYQASTP